MVTEGHPILNCDPTTEVIQPNTLTSRRVLSTREAEQLAQGHISSEGQCEA